jgi:periplasmic nitrate reductase NapE
VGPFRALSNSPEAVLMPSLRQDASDATAHKRRKEIYAFLIVTALVMPALAVATVGTYGLTVWIYQAINGPPGPPSR